MIKSTHATDLFLYALSSWHLCVVIIVIDLLLLLLSLLDGYYYFCNSMTAWDSPCAVFGRLRYLFCFFCFTLNCVLCIFSCALCASTYSILCTQKYSIWSLTITLSRAKLWQFIRSRALCVCPSAFFLLFSIFPRNLVFCLDTSLLIVRYIICMLSLLLSNYLSLVFFRSFPTLKLRPR